MNTSIFFILWLGLGTLLGRTWTNSEGKTIEAKYIKSNANGTVILQLDSNFRNVTYPIGKLSVEDQKFLKKLEKEKDEADKSDALNSRFVKWHDEFDDATEEAGKLGLPILMLFTGSDWCYYCKELEKNVFSKNEFDQYVKQNLVLLKLDFPSAGVKPRLEDHYRAMRAKYEVTGYPTVFLLTSEGKQIKRYGGYGKETVSEYIERVDNDLKSSL